MSIDLEVARRFIEDHPAEAAATLEQVSFGDAAALLAELDPSLASRAVGRFSASLAVECLLEMPQENVTSLLERLPLDVAARMLRRADAHTREVWLEALSGERAGILRRKLRYPPGTAGALADPLVLALPEDQTVADAQKQLHRSASRAYYYIYVVDREQRLVGALDIRELFLSQAKKTLRDVMRQDLVRLSALSDLNTILTHPGWRDLDALPVVDAQGVFFGIVRHRLVRQLTGHTPGDGVEPMVGALVNLGELYWTGLSAFLAGVNAPAQPPHSTSSTLVPVSRQTR
jgi:magnesium transporter